MQWPPVYVKSAVAKHVNGVMATFGTIARSGKRQLTVNGLPAYTYQGNTAGVVKVRQRRRPARRAPAVAPRGNELGEQVVSAPPGSRRPSVRPPRLESLA